MFGKAVISCDYCCCCCCCHDDDDDMVIVMIMCGHHCCVEIMEHIMRWLKLWLTWPSWSGHHGCNELTGAMMLNPCVNSLSECLGPSLMPSSAITLSRCIWSTNVSVNCNLYMDFCISSDEVRKYDCPRKLWRRVCGEKLSFKVRMRRDGIFCPFFFHIWFLFNQGAN